LDFTAEFEALRPDLQMGLQNSKRGSITRKRREENIAWVKALTLDGLQHKKIERQISIMRTKVGEEIVIQYPGKESVRGEESTKNPWDFRPKLTKRDNVDLTFEQIWDPLFDDLGMLEGRTRGQVGSVLATLYYRIAYLVDYKKNIDDSYETKAVPIDKSISKEELPAFGSVGPFWAYYPPRRAVDFVAAAVPKWAGMSFEAFLHYNSLLAWNEDMKCVDNYKGWYPGDPRGRINTLLTYIRVIGFILEEVRPSTLLGGFTRSRGMSPAQDDEIRKICFPFIS